MSKYITELNSNIKGTQHLHLESPWVLLLGANGSGKSALIHTVELGCFGGVKDAAGRDMKQKGYLKTLTERGEEAEVSITLNENSQALSFGDKRTEIPFVDAMGHAMEALTGSTNNLLRFLTTHIEDDEATFDINYNRWEAFQKKMRSPRLALLELEQIARKALTAHRATSRELKAALKYSAVASIREQKHHADEHIRKTTSLIKEIESAMYSFCEKHFVSVAASISARLPSRFGPAKFYNINNQLRLGLNSGAVPSGAETVALAIALAGALENQPSKMFILPDRAYDPHTLGELLRCLRCIPNATAWVQATTMPEGYDAEAMGWHVVVL